MTSLQAIAAALDLDDMRKRALDWATCSDGTLISRDEAINEASMALDVLDAIAEIQRLRAPLDEREADMHMRIRLDYDKTVANAWRAENERLRARVIEAFQAGMCVGYARPQGGSQTYHREAAERWAKEAEAAAAKVAP